LKQSAWRLLKTRHLPRALDGEGAASVGGRWNSSGVRVVYASASLALAALELLVRIGMSDQPIGCSSIGIEFDESQMLHVNPAILSSNWRASPSPPELRSVGDRWVAGKESLLLQVPSVIIPTENNYLINPSHPDFGSLSVHPAVPFEFDPRLLARETRSSPPNELSLPARGRIRTLTGRSGETRVLQHEPARLV